MIKTVRHAFSLAEAMITITIVSLVMAVTMPIIIKSQSAPSEAPWKYVTLGDLSQNAAVYTVLGGSAVSVFGDKKVPIDTSITANKSHVFASKINPKLSIVARNHSFNPLVARHLIDFYERHATDADTYYNIGKISFDNYYNMAIGKNALDNIITTSKVTFSDANNATLWSTLNGWDNTTNNEAALNTAVGQYAMGGDRKNLAYGGSASTDYPTKNMSGVMNTAVGAFAMRRNTTGKSNTAVGAYALESATNTNTGQGVSNTAVGSSALRVNANGNYNVAVGVNSLASNTSGSGNVAIGVNNSNKNTTGTHNTAIGHEALQANTTAAGNSAFGSQSLKVNTTGGYNTALGYGALTANTTGTKNTAVGYQALRSVTTGANNTAIGYDAAGTQNSANKLYISANSGLTGTNALIYGDDTSGARKLFFNVTTNHIYLRTESSATRLVTREEMEGYAAPKTAFNDMDLRNSVMLAYSDARLKNILGDNTAGLKEILQLKVKNYTMKKDKKKEVMVGVIAQELQKVFPNSVSEGRDGYLRIKRDEIFYACVNAIKELHAMFQDVIAKVAGLDEKIRLLEDRNKLNEEKITALEKQNKMFEERLSALENGKVKKAEKKAKIQKIEQPVKE